MPFIVAKIDKNDCVESFWRLLEWIQSPENTLRFLIVFREFNFASPHLFSLAKSFPGSAGSHCCCARALLSTLKPSSHHTSKMCASYCTSHPRSAAVGTFGIDMPEMFHLCEGKGCVYFSCSRMKIECSMFHLIREGWRRARTLGTTNLCLRRHRSVSRHHASGTKACQPPQVCRQHRTQRAR